MFLETGSILKKRAIAPGIYSLWLETTKIAKTILPGQFVGVRFPNLFDPYLRRPFAVADTDGTRLRLVFRICGRGTSLLAEKSEGQYLSLLGPLGSPIPEIKNQEVVCVGGGVGIAPLLALGKSLIKANKVSFFLGAKNGAELIMREEFSRLKGEGVFLATETGEIGEKGKISELLARSNLTENSIIFASGPLPMYSELRRLLPNKIYVFLEERMGCGTGLCLSCVVRKKGGGWLHICQDGPVCDLSLVEL